MGKKYFVEYLLAVYVNAPFLLVTPYLILLHVVIIIKYFSMVTCFGGVVFESFIRLKNQSASGGVH